MSYHLRQAWAASVVPMDGTRFVHMFLPEDPAEAHRALMAFAPRVARKQAEQINPPEAGDYDRNRLHDLVGKGGFSTHPWRHDAPSRGFMASYDDPDGKLGRVHHVSEISPEHIAEHRNSLGNHLRDKSSYQGGWLDREHGDVYLDSSKHFKNEGHARQFALKNKQKAYFDLHKGDEYFLDPSHDPKYHEDPQAHAEKYHHITKKYGPGAPKEFENYRHLYPHSERHEQAKEAMRAKLDDTAAHQARLAMKLNNGYWS